MCLIGYTIDVIGKKLQTWFAHHDMYVFLHQLWFKNFVFSVSFAHMDNKSPNGMQKPVLKETNLTYACSDHDKKDLHCHLIQ